MKYDLVSIGSITKDIFVVTGRGKIFKTPKDLLASEWLGFELGEKICADDIMETAGGVATNLALGTKKLGLKSALLGPAQATTSVILLDKKTDDRVIFYKSASGAIGIQPLARMKTKWLSVSSLTGNWKKHAADISAYIRKNNAKLIVAPSTSMIREGLGNLKKLLSSTEILFLNKNEALEILRNQKNGKTGTDALINSLHSLGPKIVCLTDGTNGAWASDGNKIFRSPIKKVKTVDVTGAGDAFAAGFLGIFIRTGDIRKSLRAGILNSASVVKYIGTTKGLLSKGELRI